jgi:REP element-mobilizing transposase RayT
MAGICKNHMIVAFAIGGMEDHVHVLLRLPPVLAVARAVSTLKANSFRGMSEQGTGFFLANRLRGVQGERLESCHGGDVYPRPKDPSSKDDISGRISRLA